MILIVGGLGNMGKRYRLILESLGKSTCVVDKMHDYKTILDLAMQSDGIIIATPTDTHIDFINLFAPLGKPILCEKPLCKDLDVLQKTFNNLKKYNTPFSMILQYGELVDPNSTGVSSYNFFRHGSDGLFWDCIQIIGLAKGIVGVSEKSHIWKCEINGKKINVADMDYAYERFIFNWLLKPSQDLDMLFNMHKKVKILANSNILLKD